MFCGLGLIFGGTEGVEPRFHVFRGRTRFRWYRERRVKFSCFALPNSLLALSMLSGPVFLFCVPGLGFGGTEVVGTCFHVLCVHTRFWLYRGRKDPFLCFALPVSFSAVPRALGPVFMFCAPGLIFEGTEGVGSRFHVLRSQTHFRRKQGRRVPFSSFPAVLWASCPIFMSCAPILNFGGTESVRIGLHVLRIRTHFRRYRGRLVPFSCFAYPNSFSTIPRTSAPVFMFCALGLFFGGTEGVGSCFHVLRVRTRFGR
jgi:hypothetical protein